MQHDMFSHNQIIFIFLKIFIIICIVIYTTKADCIKVIYIMIFLI